MSPLWTIADILKATGGAGPAEGDVYGVAVDSREAAPGDLFIALKGVAQDGHDFVKEALALGAVAALVSKTPKGLKKTDPRLIHVDDTMGALLQLAKAARRRMKGKVIAITGSAGKTGTKDAIHAALARRWKSHTSVRSFNNRVGVPLSLARMPGDTEFGVFEVGMNSPGEIAPLSQLLKPDAAVITNVGRAHIGAFRDEQAVAREKASIFKGLNKRTGIAVLNRDGEHFEMLETLAAKEGVKKTVTFATDSRGADARLVKAAMHARCSCLNVTIQGTSVTFKVAMPGHHWIMNSLAVMLTIRAVGGDLGLAGLTLASLAPQPGRGDIRDVEGPRGAFTLLDDSYNANPSSMKAALEVFSKMEPENAKARKIAVLADMEELGKFAKDEHLALAPLIEAAGVDVLYARGRHMAALLEALSPAITGFAISENAGIAQKLAQDLRPGDMVLIKGSRAARLDEVVSALTNAGATDGVSGWGRPREAA